MDSVRICMRMRARTMLIYGASIRYGTAEHGAGSARRSHGVRRPQKHRRKLATRDRTTVA